MLFANLVSKFGKSCPVHIRRNKVLFKILAKLPKIMESGNANNLRKAVSLSENVIIHSLKLIKHCKDSDVESELSKIFKEVNVELTEKEKSLINETAKAAREWWDAIKKRVD